MRLLALVAACTLPVVGTAQELTPDDFAYGLTVEVPGEAAAYRAALPLAVYQKAVRTDLADVRVFNGQGKVVPYGLERPQPVTTVQGAAAPLPIFPVRGDSAKALDSLRITIEAGGTRVNAQTAGKEGTTATVTSYVLDGRSLTTPVAAFDLSWPESAPDYAGRLRVEASEDLGNWSVVIDGAPIANLRAGDTRLVERRVEIPSTRSKFWRLSWSATPAPFEIVSVVAEPARDHIEVARETLAVAGTAVANKPGEFDFDLGAHLPLDRVNIELPEQNTVVQIALLSRATPKDTWQPVTRSGFYRLKSEVELKNGALPVPVNTDRYWLARVDASAGGVGDGTPKLQVGWLPHEVVFLARGAGPFTLGYGSAAAPAIKASLGSIPSGAMILRASFGEPKTLGGEQRLQVIVTKTFPWKSAILWVVLAIGVAILGAMAWRLSRELK